MRAHLVDAEGGTMPPPDEPRRLWRPNDADYQHGHGMEPLEDIHAERDSIAPRFAELAPLHGPAKKWEHKRKALLALVKMDLRSSWPHEFKPTEGALDDAARVDPRYKKFLDDGIKDATEYEMLDVRMGNLAERANRGQIIGRLRSSEAHMTPAGA